MAENTTTHEDSRVLRTRKVIQEALIELTVEKGYGAITVQDIVDRAKINRSTFYRHYLDKDDLLSKYMDDVTESKFKDDFLNHRIEHPEELPTGLVKLLLHIQTFSAFYRVMLSANGHPLVSERIRQKIEKRFRAVFAHIGAAPDSPTPQYDMRLRYMSAAGIGAILWWVENDTPCSAEALATWIGELISSSLQVPNQMLHAP